MTLTEAKELLRAKAAGFFSEATVLFSDQSRGPKPALPLLTLSFGDLRRPIHPSYRGLGASRTGSYRCTVPVTVDLFTRGAALETEAGTVWQDDAQDELLSFLDYLGSDPGVDWCAESDVAILPEGPVRSLSGLLEGTSREYRARAELLLSFTMEAGTFAAPLALDGGFFEEAAFAED